MTERQAHWQQVYERKPSDSVSWFEESPAQSLALIERAGVGRDEAVIDIGGGASRLADALLDRGFGDVSVLDIAESALDVSRARLGQRSGRITWLVEDITRWTPARDRYGLWHDRAVFHFLTDEDDRAAYLAALRRGLRPGGHLILATFAPTGPERCSGLTVQRYSADSLQGVVGPDFELMWTEGLAHTTPAGGGQDFTWCLFRRRATAA